MGLVDRNGFPKNLFDGAEKTELISGAEGYGAATGSGTGGPSDPVDVAFRFVWEVVVDHEGDVADIDPTGSDVGCDEDRSASVTESVETALAGGLGFIAVDGIGGDPRF